MSIDRRNVLKAGAGASAALLGLSSLPLRAQSQDAPIRLGLLTIKTGQMASAGTQFEQGLTLFLKSRNFKLAGRRVELSTVDTTNTPSVARSKTQELVESRKVHCLVGPVSAFEALAIDDYIKQYEVPTIGTGAADDLTQRRPNPWFIRATSSASQCSHPLADYALNELRFKRIVTIGEDNAYGYEQVGGLQRVFEAGGGKVVQKLWAPTASPDYATYISSINPKADAIFLALAGPNGFRFLRQAGEYGLRSRMAVFGGMTAIDEPFLKNLGEDSLGIISASWYTAQLQNAQNATLVSQMKKEHQTDPGFYAASTFTSMAVLEHALNSINGQAEDKHALMRALRGATVAESCRGPVSFDKLGNAVGNVYIRRVEKKNGELVNSVLKTYPDVGQFYNIDSAEYLKNPSYSRTFPVSRFLES